VEPERRIELLTCSLRERAGRVSVYQRVPPQTAYLDLSSGAYRAVLSNLAASARYSRDGIGAACGRRGLSGRLGSAAPVDVAAVLDAYDDDLLPVLVETVDDAIRATSG
jgi:hypothetical protein